MLLLPCLYHLDSPISPSSPKCSTCGVLFKGHSSMPRGRTLTSCCHGKDSKKPRYFKMPIFVHDDRRPRTIVNKDPRAHSGQKLVSLPKTYGTNATSWATTPSLSEVTINTPKRSQLPTRPFKRPSFGHVRFRNVVCHNYRYL
jgi:hypothetical protein